MRTYAPLLITCAAFIACKKHTCNLDASFNKDTINTATYKAALVRKLQHADFEQLDCYIGEYTEQDNKQYLTIWMHSDTLCAAAAMDVTSCKRMEHVKKLKGMSYQSAGITGIKFHIDSTNSDYRFVMEEYKYIID